MIEAFPDAADFLTRFVEKHGSPLPEFEIWSEADCPKSLDYWFGSDRWRATGHRFSLLAADSTGGMYCIWTPPDSNDEDDPVVFMGSEGEGVGAIASTAWELLQVVATGHFYAGHSESYTMEGSEYLSDRSFRQFTRRVGAIAGPLGGTPRDVLAAARRKHPGFADWVEEQID